MGAQTTLKQSLAGIQLKPASNAVKCSCLPDPMFGIIERGVPQAYVRARASSETLCSVRVLRVFLCIFYIKEGI